MLLEQALVLKVNQEQVEVMDQMDQMEQMAPMMGMMIGPMKKAAESIAAKIRSGEIASADDVSAAMQMEVMKSLGGGGGGGRRGK